MTYRCEGNDPNRAHDYPSPAEVKAMMSGQDDPQECDCPDARTLADLVAKGPGVHKTSGTPQEVADEVMVWLNGERSVYEQRAAAKREDRCGTCGRETECCCQGCTTCPQSKMEAGKVSAAHARRQARLGRTDPRGMR